MGSKVGKVLGSLAPVAAAFIPGIGLPLAAAIGAGGGLLSGNGLKGALLGGATGALGAGAGSLAGLSGLSGSGLGALEGAIKGGSIGLGSTGNLGAGFTGALTGGALGGANSYLNENGGLGGVWDSLTGGGGADAVGGTSNGITSTAFANGGADAGSGLTGVGTGGISNTAVGGGASSFANLGSSAPGGSSFGGLSIDPTKTIAAASGAGSSGGGIGDWLSKIGSSSDGASSGGNGLSNLFSGGLNAYSQNQATDQLVKSQQASLDALQPFAQNGLNASNALGDYLGTSGNTGASNYGAGTAAFSPDQLQSDPGYQFNLDQGNNALNNSLSAMGGLQSGAAIKAGQQFAQGLAGTTYNNAFGRDQAQKQLTYSQLAGAAQPGLTAAGGIADVNSNIGAAQSKGTQALSNTVAGTLSNLLSGGGSKNIVGYKPDGTPIYG